MNTIQKQAIAGPKLFRVIFLVRGLPDLLLIKYGCQPGGAEYLF